MLTARVNAITAIAGAFTAIAGTLIAIWVIYELMWVVEMFFDVVDGWNIVVVGNCWSDVKWCFFPRDGKQADIYIVVTKLMTSLTKCR